MNFGEILLINKSYSFNSQFTGPRKEMCNVLLTVAIYFRSGDSSENKYHVNLISD